jgi:hypothetical protein
MAIVRCGKQKPEAAKGNAYAAEHLPVGHPASGLICGRKDCAALATVWLKTDEEHAYRSGERIFELPTRAAKVQVQ